MKTDKAILNLRKYHVKTLYGGERLETLCDYHARQTAARIESNAEHAHFPYAFVDCGMSAEKQCKYCKEASNG